jgi:hypothetical protein
MPIDLGRPVSDHPLNQSLVHWWMGLPNLANGSRLEDIAGFAPATLTNGPTWDADPNLFPCLSFDGTNDYATAGDLGDTEGVTALSVSAFVYSTTLAGGTDGLRYICSKEDGGGLIWILRQLTGGDKLQWYCQTGVGTFGPQEVTGFTANAWHHVVATYQSGVGLDLYRNGISSSSTGFATIGTLTTNSAPVSIGSLASTSGRAWSGLITDVRIAQRRYSQQDAWALYEQAIAGNPLLLNRYTNTAYFLPCVPVDSYRCSNEVLVDGVSSIDSPWRLGTALTAGAVLGGDLPSVPPVSAVYHGANAVGVLDAAVAVATGLQSTRNAVLVGSAGSTIARFSCANTVAVGSAGRTSIGNQIAGDRYRR